MKGDNIIILCEREIDMKLKKEIIKIIKKCLEKENEDRK